MSPDELIIMIGERLQGTDIRWKINNYAATRAAAERLLRTMQIIPDEPPKAIPPGPMDSPTMVLPKVKDNVDWARQRYG